MYQGSSAITFIVTLLPKKYVTDLATLQKRAFRWKFTGMLDHVFRRLEKVNWEEVEQLTTRDLVDAAYLDGARDALDFLGMLLEGEIHA
jgi:hypothetical protein